MFVLGHGVRGSAAGSRQRTAQVTPYPGERQAQNPPMQARVLPSVNKPNPLPNPPFKLVNSLALPRHQWHVVDKAEKPPAMIPDTWNASSLVPAVKSKEKAIMDRRGKAIMERHGDRGVSGRPCSPAQGGVGLGLGTAVRWHTVTVVGSVPPQLAPLASTTGRDECGGYGDGGLHLPPVAHYHGTDYYMYPNGPTSAPSILFLRAPHAFPETLMSPR